MIEIKKIGLAELEEVAILFNAYRVFYNKPSDIESGKAFLKERIQKEESIVYGAYEGDTMVGFTQLYPLFSSVRMKRLWLLNDLFVQPTARGKGISIKLIDAAKELCRQTDACSLCLETGQDNVVGNQLYPRTGFELDEEYNHYEWTTV